MLLQTLSPAAVSPPLTPNFNFQICLLIFGAPVYWCSVRFFWAIFLLYNSFTGNSEYIRMILKIQQFDMKPRELTSAISYSAWASAVCTLFFIFSRFLLRVSPAGLRLKMKTNLRTKPPLSTCNMMMSVLRLNPKQTDSFVFCSWATFFTLGIRTQKYF